MGDVPTLVLRAQEGDREAFAFLYDEFAPLVRAVAYDATGCLQESEDLCQEVFLQAHKSLRQLRDPASFPSWLMVTTRRRCASWGRAEKRRPSVGLDEVETPAVASAAHDDEIQRMLNAIRQLPPQERMALHLFYLAEQPAELARQTLGLSTAGFYKVLERAKRRASVLLQERKGPQ